MYIVHVHNINITLHNTVLTYVLNQPTVSFTYVLTYNMYMYKRTVHVRKYVYTYRNCNVYIRTYMYIYRDIINDLATAWVTKGVHKNCADFQYVFKEHEEVFGISATCSTST